MSLFRCPVCGGELEKRERAYCCGNGHAFDRAASGYVNLLLSGQKNAADPGDDKAMCRSRRDFLEAGYYSALADALGQTALELPPQAGFFLDVGCGEGYYTRRICSALALAGRNVSAAGVDISKHAVQMAAKSDKGGDYAVASGARLPVGDEVVDLLLSCFSPVFGEEFERVIKPGGHLIVVEPAPSHLWEMKVVLYDSPYPNKPNRYDLPGFKLISSRPVETKLPLKSREDIQNLFHMTPYFWNTPREGIERLEKLTTLEIEAAFLIHIYRR